MSIPRMGHIVHDHVEPRANCISCQHNARESTSPPPTEEAVAILRDLRERATSHHDMFNAWALIDTIDAVVVLLERWPES